MKFGMRRPSMLKSISSRTKGRATRELKKAFIPDYGKKGSGIYHNPSKALYNKVYNKSTFDIRKVGETSNARKRKTESRKTEDFYNEKVTSDFLWMMLLLLAVTLLIVSAIIQKNQVNTHTRENNSYVYTENNRNTKSELQKQEIPFSAERPYYGMDEEHIDDTDLGKHDYQSHTAFGWSYVFYLENGSALLVKTENQKVIMVQNIKNGKVLWSETASGFHQW